jgi:hypothetical protein
MVKVDRYARVRRTRRNGLGVRALTRLFHHLRRKIREILAIPEPKPYVRLNPALSIVDPFKQCICAMAGCECHNGRTPKRYAWELTIMKNRGCVANFFHSGQSLSR